MDINRILNEYDEMFTRNTPDEIAGFLDKYVGIAEQEGDKAALLTLLNEQIGFARDRGMRETAIEGCARLKALIPELGIEGTIFHGKTLLNIANAYRVFGNTDEAELLFEKIEQIYINALPEGAYDYAALYNNWSLLALGMGNASKAADLVILALDVVDRYDQAVIEQATSRVNLACILMDEAGTDEAASSKLYEEAGHYIDDAVSRFEAAGGDDFHFASALSAKGDWLMRTGSYNDAADCYEKAKNILKIYIGDSRKTSALDSKIDAARKLCGTDV